MFIWTFRFSQWSILLSPVILNFISETPCMLDTLLCTKISKTRSRVVLSMTSILLHARQSHITKMAKNPFSKIWRKTNTGLLKMIVSVLTTCHTQYTWDSGICIFLFDRTTLQVFVTYLTGALYVHPVWFYKHQHDNRVRSKLCVACQRWWFQWRFRFVPSVPGYLREEEKRKPDPGRKPIERTTYSYLKCIVYEGCPKSKCTDFLFKFLLGPPEITSYLLHSMTLAKLHGVFNVFSTDYSSTGNHSP